MRKAMMSVFISIVFCFVLSSGFAQETAPAKGDGGMMPGFASCCLGPRIGLEMNEGKPIEIQEWLQLVVIGAPLCWYKGYQAAGVGGCFAAWLLGPRVGRELNERNIRTMEWVKLGTDVIGLPIGRLMIALEAMDGKTMTEIEQKENIKK